MSALLQALAVGTGGFVGSILRWAVAGAALALTPGLSPGGEVRFPTGTLAVNVIGCLGIGLFGGWLAGGADPDPTLRLLLVTGVLGGFTTFSSFGWETVQLWREVGWGAAALNVGLQLALGLGAAALGYAWAAGEMR